MVTDTPVFSDRFADGLLFALEKHGAQRRNSSPGDSAGPSYMGHLLGVAALVIEDDGSEAEVIGALLHDTLEDTDVTAEELDARFGPEVTAIVIGCTDSHEEPRPEWRERKEQYLAHLREASPSVLRVSNADKLYNARTILSDYRVDGEGLWSRFSGGRSGVFWYYRSLADAYLGLNPGPLADELARVVDELEQLASSA